MLRRLIGDPLQPRPIEFCRKEFLRQQPEQAPLDAPDQPPNLSWPGWADIARDMKLNDELGPAVVRDAFLLFYQQQIEHHQPFEMQRLQRSVASELQRLNAALWRAERQASGCMLQVLLDTWQGCSGCVRRMHTAMH